MISIIICSRDLHLYNKVLKSIEETIGVVTYEIIKVNNLVENVPITKAYNIGIQKSKYEYLLFIHEDVLFHTKNWGEILTNIFANNLKIGLVGIAGAKYKSKFPSAFWHTKEELLTMNLIQHQPYKETSHINRGFKESSLEKVVVIDGVFIGLRKSTTVKFNEEILGFHCYDLGISIDVFDKQYQIVVTNQILIEHFSIGNTDFNFLKSVINFHKLYKKQLPKYIERKDSSLENVALKKFLGVCLSNRFIPFNLWMYNLLKNPFERLNYSILKLVAYEFKKKIKCLKFP
ncbi:glycosyltransferase [Flavobacterium sp. 5]|uniref:glycosyltransferase n=1 Tax=Flavobacterium sp. 5 TaxID=2035199 RepID=UPI000C2C091F|nr:glycosyltransferase [Flavobacterium sp. 5]PKB17459.1 glycosyl transferase family 2 [Flavobacterium sp. 5]